jgi:hypothetical protein
MHDLFDHLDEKAKAWAAFIGGAILFLIEAGLQVSGFTNLLLAIFLWGAAFILFLHWLHYIAPKEWLRAARVFMASWPFVASCFVIALVAVGAGAYPDHQ